MQNTMNHIDTMKQALEALENGGHMTYEGLCKAKAASDALRLAIEQAEKQEPVAWLYPATGQTFNSEPPPSLKAQCRPLYTAPPQRQPEQEPVDVAEIAFEAWWRREGEFLRAGGGDYEKTFARHAWIEALACTAPPQRQPLTVEQISEIEQDGAFWDDHTPLDFVRAIERAHGIGGEA